MAKAHELANIFDIIIGGMSASMTKDPVRLVQTAKALETHITDPKSYLGVGIKLDLVDEAIKYRNEARKLAPTK